MHAFLYNEYYDYNILVISMITNNQDNHKLLSHFYNSHRIDCHVSCLPFNPNHSENVQNLIKMTVVIICWPFHSFSAIFSTFSIHRNINTIIDCFIVIIMIIYIYIFNILYIVYTNLFVYR